MLIYIRFTTSLPITYRELNEDFLKFFQVFSRNVFDSHKIGPRVIFHQFSDTFPKLFQQLHSGYTLKPLLTNCSFHAENMQTLVFCTDLI